MNSTPPANWYPDPDDNRFARYWNGTEWTVDRRPAAPDSGRVGQETTSGAKVPLFGARAHAKRQSREFAELQDENRRLREQLDRLGSHDLAELQQQRDQYATEIAKENALLASIRADIVYAREEQMLQEVGIYDYHHPLSDAVNYRDELQRLQREIKRWARSGGGAIEVGVKTHIDGSHAKGSRMIRDYSKLMLRAYNTEVENLVRGLKPYNLHTALKRLDKLASDIEKLGNEMHLRIAPEYHFLRTRELKATAAHRDQVAQQKEQEREERAREREERKAQQEMARERTKIDREKERYRNTLAEYERTGMGNSSDADQVRDKLKELDFRGQQVDYQAEHTSAGYVYVISNIGAFGEDRPMLHIGFTRRQNPGDRIRDLNNAAVPFPFDIHAIFPHDNAAGIEAELHHRLADRRVNRINTRREFFYATPMEVRELLEDISDGRMLKFKELAEAEHYHQSRAMYRATPAE